MSTSPDYVDRRIELRKYFPEPTFNLKDGEGLAILLDAIGKELNEAGHQIDNAKLQFVLSSATGYYLELWGVQYDVFKPRGSRMRDPSYRKLIKIVSNTQKSVEYIFERLLKIFFGERVFERGYADTYSYRPGELVVRISKTAMIIASSRDLYGTSYIHATNDKKVDGVERPRWRSVLAEALPTGATTVRLASVPPECPERGMVELGDASTDQFEEKVFVREGALLRLASPTFYPQPQEAPCQGPQEPDDYPSGYVYDARRSARVLGSYQAGVMEMRISDVGEGFPESGVLMLGEVEEPNFEVKGFERQGSRLILAGPASHAHQSGEPIDIPYINRKIHTRLTSPIEKGESHRFLFVENAADFPAGPHAVKFNISRANEEIVPFRSRVVGDNSLLEIDPGYVFLHRHEAGEIVRLMARKTVLSKTGEDWPLYVVDSDALRDQFLSILKRVKVAGFKLKIDFV